MFLYAVRLFMKPPDICDAYHWASMIEGGLIGEANHMILQMKRILNAIQNAQAP